MKDELIDITDRAISELVYDKEDLQKAYNYYYGILDEDQYKYLEEEYGIGNPTSMVFIPLIKKHVDALVGEIISTPILPKVTCKDSNTISKITREKELTIAKEVFDFLNKRLQNKLISYFQTGQKPTDLAVQHDIDELKESIESSYVSEYEAAAQNVVEYLLQSRSIDFKNKLKQLALDTLISGEQYYRVKESGAGNNITIEDLDPRNTFPEMDPESNYVKDAKRIVVRKWMSKQDIISEYGDKLTSDEIGNLDDLWGYLNEISYTTTVAVGQNKRVPLLAARSRNRKRQAGYPTNILNDYENNLIPVYEVEWIETDKKTYIQNRYRTVRIGTNIYILYGKDENVVRSMSDPRKCSISVNGIQHITRSGIPYSMVLACAPLQDKYNVLVFYRDNLIASAGTAGDILDIAVLPKMLGQNFAERFKKWQAYKKQGTAIIDSSQEGRLSEGLATPNTIYNGFDDTVRLQSVQAIQMAMDSIEATCSSITGVFRERLNGIQQRDAVTNVQVSQNNSFVVTKQFTQQIDTLVEEMLLDSLNMAKKVFKNGLIGTLVLGDKESRIFTALPQYFTLTDYDIHIVTTTDITRQLEQLKQLMPDFIKGGFVPPDLIIDGVTCTSLSDYKIRLKNAIKKQREENNQIKQLSQQNQQMQQQLQQMQKELQKAQGQLQQLNQAKMQLEKEKITKTLELDWYKARTDRTYKDKQIGDQIRRTDIEIAQLHDGNPYNDVIKKT